MRTLRSKLLLGKYECDYKKNLHTNNKQKIKSYYIHIAFKHTTYISNSFYNNMFYIYSKNTHITKGISVSFSGSAALAEAIKYMYVRRCGRSDLN